MKVSFTVFNFRIFIQDNLYFLDQFMYSEEEGTSKFGPPVKISSSDLCISLYAFMCNSCLMEFLIESNGKKEMLQEINNVSNY